MFKQNIIYLYSEVMGYTLATIKKLVDFGYEVHIVHWDEKKLTPFETSKLKGINFYPRSKFDSQSIIKLFIKIEPSLTVVSGWMDKEYLKVARFIRNNGGLVVSGMDTQFDAGFKHLIFSLAGRLGFFKKYFSHAWVSGLRQYEFAKKIGFDTDKILLDLYSADLDFFQKAFQQSIAHKSEFYPKKMLFVGRFVEVKGIKNLLEAWLLSNASLLGWELVLVGNGPLKDILKTENSIKILDFMNSNELADLSKQCGCFILPSNKEPWGVVIHEFAAAGLPIICTKFVGSSERFVINHGNGIIIPSSSVKDIKIGIEYIIRKKDEELFNMGVLSNILSNRITPTTSALNLISLIK